jgi:hypothetical protein
MNPIGRGVAAMVVSFVFGSAMLGRGGAQGKRPGGLNGGAFRA